MNTLAMVYFEKKREKLINRINKDLDFFSNK